MNELTLKSAIACIGSMIGGLLGGWDMFLKVLLILIATDYITGVLKAVYTKELSSEIGYKGIIKKVAMLLVVILGTQMDLVLGTSQVLRTGVIFFWISNEGISILENVGKMGLTIPKIIKDALLKLRDDNKTE